MNKEKEIDCAPQMTTYMVPHEKKRDKKADMKQKTGQEQARQKENALTHVRIIEFVRTLKLEGYRHRMRHH